MRIVDTRQIESEPDNSSEVEVRFSAEAPDRTRVELEHRHLNGHGPGWQAVADGVADDAGWLIYLARYAALVDGMKTCHRSRSVQTSTGLPTTSLPTPPTHPDLPNGRRVSSAATWRADGSPSVGDHCVTVRRIGFANRPSTSELVRIDPPRSRRVHGIDGPIRAIVQVTVASLAADRSRLTISIDFEGHGIGALLVPMIVRRQARSEMPTNITKLKARLEDPS
jgi:hypothetical protein